MVPGTGRLFNVAEKIYLFVLSTTLIASFLISRALGISTFAFVAFGQ
jgi:hypothetical protein